MRYNKIIRRVLRWLSHYVFEDTILKYLYPDDMRISFPEQKEQEK